jgi:energy-converting hydrogenase Eha subunit B
VAAQDPPPPQPGLLGDFLQPQSMVTPGLLGALVMMATNSLCAKFPGLNGAVVALVLSLLFGLAAVIREPPFSPARAVLCAELYRHF